MLRRLTMNDLPILRLPVPGDLPRKGNWIDNGPLSNMNPGEALIRYRSVSTHYVEPAYVAAKAPDVMVPSATDKAVLQPFHERVASCEPRRSKSLGSLKARGGLIDPRPDWEDLCIGAMASFLAQKFVPGTREAAWLLAQDPSKLIEWTNWRDERWGVAFRDGDAYATGRNCLGFMLRFGRERLVQGRLFPTASEEEWSALQAALVPLLIKLSAEYRKSQALETKASFTLS